MALLATSLSKVTEFYLMAAAIGSVQGGVQSLSRSYFASMVPPNKSGEFFGFYNMLAKFSAVLGPLTVALAVQFTQSSRATSYVLLSFFVVGIVLLNVSRRAHQAPK
jgi:UMF1 family MFS transporter